MIHNQKLRRMPWEVSNFSQQCLVREAENVPLDSELEARSNWSPFTWESSGPKYCFPLGRLICNVCRDT